MTNRTTKTSAENLHDLLLDLAAEAAEWLEAREHNVQQTPERLIDLIDIYHRAAREHEKSEEILRTLDADKGRVVTMEEIEEIKRRERGEG